jgi:glycosyltransferase involved in cell wall biosynthesis
MLSDRMNVPSNVLITLDAVGGVWRYAVDLARGLGAIGTRTTLLGFGPHPTRDRKAEVEAMDTTRLVWSDQTLDWMAGHEDELAGIGPVIEEVAEREGVDLLHLNLPSQASSLSRKRPIVVASHSCVITWWAAMRREALPESWRAARERNRRGFDAADIVIAPSGSHAEALERAYGPINELDVVYNSAQPDGGPPEVKQPFALAAGRWWDEAKNAAALDAAATLADTEIRLAGSARAPNGEEFGVRHARLLGEMPASEVRALMRRAAVFASPARYEPFGLAILEAAMSRCALVLADIPTFRELWDGAAIFVSPDDPAAIALTLDWLAENPDNAAEWGARAADRARGFTLEAQVSQMLDIYARAIDHHAAHSSEPRIG